MTAYNGALAPPSLSYPRSGLGGSMSADEVHAGSLALRLTGGGYRDIFYGCAAGSTTITVWVYAPVIGKCGIRVFDGQEKQGEDLNAGAGAWEQLSVTFVALKKVYIVRLFNGTIQNGDTRAYFDDLV